MEAIAEANGVQVKLAVNHESFGGSAIQDGADNWSCGTYATLLYRECLLNMESDILGVWSRFRSMLSGVLVRKVNGVIALVYEDNEDEMPCPETWLSSRNIECVCDLIGADFCVKTYPSRPKSKWLLEVPTGSMVDFDEFICVSEDESEIKTHVSITR